jgi:hypothetical protein
VTKERTDEIAAFCPHCGAAFWCPLPMSIPALERALGAFTRAHAVDCGESIRLRAREAVRAEMEAYWDPSTPVVEPDAPPHAGPSSEQSAGKVPRS